MFEDGSIGNVEIQRQGIYFPSQWAAVYSSNLVTRQYATVKTQRKSEVDFTDVQPVYTIIIMENSSGALAYSDEYIQHFQQRSDTGVELELLQYYDYVCLDVFKRRRPRIAGELEKRLKFLSIEETSEMQAFLVDNSDFQSVYDCAILMLSDKKEMLQMFTDLFEEEDIVASLNKTNESRIRIMKEQLAKQSRE